MGADDAAGTERLARYLLRPPLSLERMSWDAEGTVLYRRKARSRFSGATTFDAMDFLARLLMHIPQPKLHTVRYYGEYSSVARARRRGQMQDEASTAASLLPSAAERRRLRRSWAQMRILSFILDPRVVTKILRHIADEKASSRECAPPASALAS